MIGMIILIGIGAFVATLCGGLFALKFRDRLHLVLGFSAGAVIGVAFFDLLPEALQTGNAFFDPKTITAIVALGFILYMILDRSVALHSHDEEEHCDNPGHQPARGKLGAGSLSVHSFLDGLAIGLAFQVSAAVGTIVAIAVLVHDFSDGINTVNLIVKNGGERGTAFKWLMIDALAPVVGIIATFFFHLSEGTLSIILALFAGFFFYIGASDLLPESHHGHSTKWTTFMTVLGIGVLYAAIQIGNI